MIITELIHQEDKTIINIFTPDNPKLRNQKLTELKGKMGNSIITVGDFYISLSIMGRTPRQKIIKQIEDLNNIIILLTETYRTLHSTTTEYTFFSSTHVEHLPG